jgi:hypothetical protein
VLVLNGLTRLFPHLSINSSKKGLNVHIFCNMSATGHERVLTETLWFTLHIVYRYNLAPIKKSLRTNIYKPSAYIQRFTVFHYISDSLVFFDWQY